MANLLEVQLLGGFHIQYSDTLVTDFSPRLQSLLAYLLLNAQSPLSRQQIAFQIWPDTNEKRARGNLRRELHTLRQKLPNAEQFIQIEQRFVHWRGDAPYTADVLAFEADLTAADEATNPTDMRAALTCAVAHYQGPLFPDCYDEWIWPEREALAEKYGQALVRLIHLLEEGRQYGDALAQAQRLLRHDPLAEPTYRTLMRLHALNNDRAGALRVYHSCITMLEQELDVPPESETEQFYRQIIKADRREDRTAEVPPKRTVRSVLVGRDAEWAQLRNLWEATQQGGVHFVLVSGEAGIGKSQLTEEFERWVGRQGGAVATTRAYEVEDDLAYTPVIEWLRSDLLQQVVAQMDDVWLVELARLLPELLMERPDLSPPQPMTENHQRQRLFESLTRVFQAVDEPLLLLLDDMHWCDQETASWLQYLFSAWTRPPLLLVATVRPEEVPEAHPAHALWRDLRVQGSFHEIALQPLSETETIALANQVAGKPIDAETVAQLYAESEGVPLFLVEMVRVRFWEVNSSDEQSVAPAGHLPGSQDVSLPPQIQAVIETRLSRLSASARRIAALAATIGRSFGYDLLVEASGEDEDTLVEGLDELWQRRIIREQGAFSYVFSHDKIREVAYRQVSAIRRRQLHRRVASALEHIHANEPESVSGQLAFHCERAGLVEKAVAWHQKTAEAAQQLFAFTEGISHLRSAIDLLDTLPEDDMRKVQKVDMLFSLSRSMVEVHGLAYVERDAPLLRAIALASSLEDSRPLLTVLINLSFFYLVRGERQKAQNLSEESLRVAQQSDDPMLQAYAYGHTGTIALFSGDFADARDSIERAHTISYDDGRNNFLSIVYWAMGKPDQTRKLLEQRLKQTEADDKALVTAAFFASIVYRGMKSPQLLAPQVETQVSVSEKYDDWLFAHQDAMVFRGWELAHQGALEEGIALTKKSVDILREMGHIMFMPHRLAMLIEMVLMADQVDEAQALLDEAFRISREKGERIWDAELHRLQGDLLLATGDASAAEVAYQQAIDVAQIQQAKSLELIAVLHLCRLWQAQGKQANAHARLSEIYNWFTEGFDTGLLQEAKALLDELAAAR